MINDFYTQTHCDRCHSDLRNMRTMSWFNNETICMDCAKNEDELKKKLRDSGDAKSYEGCGYIPEVKK